ncbi:MAG: alanyl-tRNA editing protein [Ferroplasma sp.]|uniref:alanyl-tRNA editing protein n=1 Tax=Ferroplasma sp. TaxID=2591003 RepID=UPI002815E22E|nr:alanyl-tRNA editing protein [Ferroplasma sp.]WMT51304.1 MAG: alanyl-tRNA editing protein [Ferroplasma sp.]
MITEEIFLKDSYLKECDGKVLMCEFTDLTVDKTIFFPTMLGQQNDKGEIVIDGKTFGIVDVWTDGDYIHLISLDTYPENIVGKTISQKLDWDVRHIHMRFRTAMFIISGLAYKFYNAKSRISQTYDDRAWVDIYIDDINEDIVNKIAEEANKIVKQNVPVKIEYMGSNEFPREKQRMSYSTGQLPDDEELRVINISGLPLQSDYGLYVANTGEVGEIEVKSSMVKGKVDKRLTITLK